MKVDFTEVFKNQDADDEDDTSLSKVLDLMRKRWPNEKQFYAADLTKEVNDISVNPQVTIDNELRDAVREFFFPTLPSHQKVIAITVGRRIKTRVDEPVRWGNDTLKLKSEKPTDGGGNASAAYWVEAIRAEGPQTAAQGVREQSSVGEVGEVVGQDDEEEF